MSDHPLQFHMVQTQKPVVGKSWAVMGEEHARAVDGWLATFTSPPTIISHQHTESGFIVDGDMPYLRIVDSFVYRT